MVAGAVDAALLRDDLRGRRIDMLADDVDALVDQSGRRGTFFYRIVPGAGEDDRHRRIGIHFLSAELIGIDGPVDRPIGCAATKPSLPVFDIAPATMPQRYWLS